MECKRSSNGVNLEKFRREKSWVHSVQMAATTATPDSIRRAKAIFGWPIDQVLPIDHYTTGSMKFIFWNCRGAGNEDFKNLMRDLYRYYEPEVVVIMETKVEFANMGNFFDSFGLTSSAISEAIGRIESIWLLRNPTLINIVSVQITHLVVHVVVKQTNYEDCLISAVYASPNKVLRKHF